MDSDLKLCAPLLSSPSESTRTFISQEHLVAGTGMDGTGAQFDTAPVQYPTIIELDEELPSKDPDDHTGRVHPGRNKKGRSRSGRKGPLPQKHREHAALVRRSGACAACKLRKVQVCTNTRRPRFSLLTGL